MATALLRQAPHLPHHQTTSAPPPCSHPALSLATRSPSAFHADRAPNTYSSLSPDSKSTKFDPLPPISSPAPHRHSCPAGFRQGIGPNQPHPPSFTRSIPKLDHSPAFRCKTHSKIGSLNGDHEEYMSVLGSDDCRLDSYDFVLAVESPEIAGISLLEDDQRSPQCWSWRICCRA